MTQFQDLLQDTILDDFSDYSRQFFNYSKDKIDDKVRDILKNLPVEFQSTVNSNLVFLVDTVYKTAFLSAFKMGFQTCTYLNNDTAVAPNVR
jgi:hypothetical protein